MRSMTGFAAVEENGTDRSLVVEIRSVNNRYLEVYCNLPSFLSDLEPEIKTRVGAMAARGKVEVTVRLREYRENLAVHVDPRAVEAAREALQEIGRIAGITREPSYADILSFEGVIHTERQQESASYRDEILNVLKEALERWDVTRLREGESTRTDIRKHIERVDHAANVFAEHGPEVEQAIYRAVRDKFREVLGDEADEQRVYAEAAALILRHATNEEVVRLRSHVEAFREVLSSSKPMGKRLDFICQEMNREINTTGSKTILPVVQAAVVEAKDAVEAIREQIRNIE